VRLYRGALKWKAERTGSMFSRGCCCCDEGGERTARGVQVKRRFTAVLLLLSALLLWLSERLACSFADDRMLTED
jgi:hypothetical protein